MCMIDNFTTFFTADESLEHIVVLLLFLQWTRISSHFAASIPSKFQHKYYFFLFQFA